MNSFYKMVFDFFLIFLREFCANVSQLFLFVRLIIDDLKSQDEPNAERNDSNADESYVFNPLNAANKPLVQACFFSY